MSVDIHNYLIEQTGMDWSELLSDWAPPLPAEFTLWLVNRFGDVFAILEDGSVHFLDIGVGTLEHVADSKEHFAEKLDAEANDWLMIPLIDKCVSAGLVLQRGQCYRFKIPPFLGGSYDLDNIFVGDLREHYAFIADIYRQTKNLPNGAKVKLVIGPEPKG